MYDFSEISLNIRCAQHNADKHSSWYLLLDNKLKNKMSVHVSTFKIGCWDVGDLYPFNHRYLASVPFVSFASINKI